MRALSISQNFWIASTSSCTTRQLKQAHARILKVNLDARHHLIVVMAGKKRTRNGQVKPSNAIQQPPADIPVTEPTPPCGQPPQPSSTSTESQNAPQPESAPTEQAVPVIQAPKPTMPAQQPSARPKSHPKSREKYQKLPKLPASTSPKLHPLKIAQLIHSHRYDNI